MQCNLTHSAAPAVYLDGKRLRMEPNEEEQEHIMAIEQGEMMLLWQLHRPDIGQALQITTGPPALRPSIP